MSEFTDAGGFNVGYENALDITGGLWNGHTGSIWGTDVLLFPGAHISRPIFQLAADSEDFEAEIAFEEGHPHCFETTTMSSDNRVPLSRENLDYDDECSRCVADHHSPHEEHEGAPSMGDLIDREVDRAKDAGTWNERVERMRTTRPPLHPPNTTEDGHDYDDDITEDEEQNAAEAMWEDG